MTVRSLTGITVATIVLLLSSCSGDDSDPASTGTTDDGSTTTTTVETTTEPATTEGAPSSSTEPEPEPDPATGCTDGDATVPDGAVSTEVVDVDGDGEPDTAWLLDADGATTVGIATAAGGGASTEIRSGSPIPRSVLVVDADETPPVEIIVSDGRGASLHAFSDCEIQPVQNPEGETYEFDLQNLRGNGTGIGCIDTEQGRSLVGLQAGERTDSSVDWKRTIIELDGLTARNGSTDSGTYELPKDEDAARLLDEITCGDLTMAEDGLTGSE